MPQSAAPTSSVSAADVHAPAQSGEHADRLCLLRRKEVAFTLLLLINTIAWKALCSQMASWMVAPCTIDPTTHACTCLNESFWEDSIITALKTVF